MYEKQAGEYNRVLFICMKTCDMCCVKKCENQVYDRLVSSLFWCFM